jgi:hypothetical protein
MTRHTIVIEVPEGADPNEVEAIVSSRLRMTYVVAGVHVDGDRAYRKLAVAEYHHEQMTTTDQEST